MGTLTSQQLADIFGVSLTSIHNWVRKRGLPHHKTIGGQLRFEPRKVRDYCEMKQVQMPERLLELTEYPWRS